jgi:hypothetical protein
MRLIVIALIATCFPIGAYAHQRWSAADERPLTRIDAPIHATTYDGTIWLTDQGKPVQVALGTPASMKARGLAYTLLAPGTEVTVYVYDSVSDDSARLYARRISIGGRMINLS